MKPAKSLRKVLPPCLALSLMACAVNSALAAEVNDLGVVGTQAASGASSGAVASKAAAVAPTRSSLTVTQPQSIISREYIESTASPVADFSAIAAIAPSVTIGISPNGPGLGETKVGIRGFKDGEFNITYDGIPFGDTNGPTHHSTAYFPASIIGEIVVERGPGNASNLGQATFGGSINLFSRPVANEAVFSPYFSVGTWNTQLYGARYDSGILPKAGDAKIAVSYQKQTSDGYQTYSGIQGENFMFKLEQPIGNSTLVTFNANYNANWYYQSDVIKGITASQATTLGKNYMLSDDPSKANYFGYNRTQKTSWMNYLRVQSDLGNGWAIDNNTYYYNYANTTLSSTGKDVTTGLGSVIDGNGTTVKNQMPGYVKVNEYWVAGNIFKATKQTSAGLARAGLWLEHATTHRSINDYNLLNGANNYDQAAVAGTRFNTINNVLYDQDSGWRQYQPFAEFEWAATDRLTVTPGIKYMHTTMSIEAQVNQGSRQNQNFSKDFSKTLPFLTANYRLAPEWSTYAQYAKGMLVPNIGNYQSSGAVASTINPQTSTNYQWGVVNKSDRLVWDADVYYIDFDNKIATVAGTSGANAVYFNQGGVVYKGIEGQATYAFEHGLSLYGNLTFNRAKLKSSVATIGGLSVAGVPDKTAALGLLYANSGWNASIVDKMVGRTYALDGSAYSLHSYSSTDLNVGYTFLKPGLGARKLKLALGIYNLFNHQDVLSTSPANTTVGSAAYGSVAAADTFTFQPERSYMTSLRAEF